MILTDNIKRAIDELQTRIVPCYESDNVLLIFDTQTDLKRYKKVHKNITPDQILVTVCDLKNLIGLRFKRFHFITDDDLKRIG